MNQPCKDSFHRTFGDFHTMLAYHDLQETSDLWYKAAVKNLEVEPLDIASPFYHNLSAFAPGTSQEAVEDTVENLGLAMRAGGKLYPMRGTAYKSLLDRAKIGGTALPKLRRDVLASVLNECMKLHSSEALLLIRSEKVSAVHSGDITDYSVLPVSKLLFTLQAQLDNRFEGNQFEGGYADHSLVSASWSMPGQKDELLETYSKELISEGKAALAAKLIPGVRFVTSDTGIASAKVSAILMGAEHPIHIGGCIAVDHRHRATVADFEKSLDQLFAKFGDSIAKLQKLLSVPLEYPINAMTRVCKKLSMPKKAAIEAISMYEMAYGGGPATAHDVFFAMQEIPFILKSQNTPESKMLVVEENMARALSLHWSDYDLAKAVEY